MEFIFFLVSSAVDYNNGSIRDSFLGLGTGGSAFTDTMIWMVIALFLLSLVYYFLINGISSGFNGLFKFNYLWAWLLTLILAGGIGAGIANYQICAFVYTGINADGSLQDIGPAGVRFVLMSTVYSMLIYTLFSFIFKRWSKYAKFIPR